MGRLKIDNARCARGIRSRIAMATAAFNKNKNLLNNKLESCLRKKLVNSGAQLSVVLKLGHLGAAYQVYLGSFEMWCWRRM